jgi:hypothetical protein
VTGGPQLGFLPTEGASTGVGEAGGVAGAAAAAAGPPLAGAPPARRQLSMPQPADARHMVCCVHAWRMGSQMGRYLPYLLVHLRTDGVEYLREAQLRGDAGYGHTSVLAAVLATDFYIEASRSKSAWMEGKPAEV